MLLYFSRMDDIRGFTRELFVEVTTNIESQELRRAQNRFLGPEHPRAATSDDVECFISILHYKLGRKFTLKRFEEQWPKLVK